MLSKGEENIYILDMSLHLIVILICVMGHLFHTKIAEAELARK